MARKNPQEKKALSYKKDGRNVYHENDKASRKNLPRKKKRVNRAYRRVTKQQISQADTAVDPELDLIIEAQIGSGQSHRLFRLKYPDQPLADHLIERLYQRVQSGMIDTAQFEMIEDRIQRRVREGR